MENGQQQSASSQNQPKRGGRNGNVVPPAPRGNQYALTHGLNTLKTAVVKLSGRAIDGRYRIGRQLQKWRRELVDDLGGLENVSTQQEALIDLAVKSKLLLDSIDAWLLTQETLISKRKKALFPVVLQRQTLADGLARYLTQLGLERRHKVKTLNEILQEDEPEARNGAVNDGRAETP
jgi:hypothetical protein